MVAGRKESEAWGSDLGPGVSIWEHMDPDLDQSFYQIWIIGMNEWSLLR